jgi:hypothetical protein
MAPATLDVAPHRDVFVPFEMPVSELEPGWYTMTCDLEIDGTFGTHDGGRRFSVPWPRSTVRRGQVKPARDVELGDGTKVLVEQVDCVGDSIKLHLLVDPPGPVSVKLAADGARLEVLEAEVDETSGRARITAYPLMRTVRTLRIELRGSGKGADGTVEVELP